MRSKVDKPFVITNITFNRIFLSVLALTLLSLAISVWVAYFSNQNQSPLQTKLFENCMTAFLMGFAAILGLIGGRASNG